MKTLTLALALAATLMLGGGALTLAQQSTHDQHKAAAAQKAPSMAMCKQMMADKEKSMAHMKAMDTKLDGLVAQMDNATGESKVDAIAAVVKELASQRKSMRSMMEGMHMKMMGHMTQHMQSGKMGACPMMKDMMMPMKKGM